MSTETHDRAPPPDGRVRALRARKRMRRKPRNVVRTGYASRHGVCTRPPRMHGFGWQVGGVLGIVAFAVPSVASGAILFTGLTNGTSAASSRPAAGGAWTRVSSATIPAVTSYGAPALADLDGDGDHDALVGQERGAIVGWRNDGHDAAPRWTRATAWDAAPIGTRSAPALGDVDGDGDADLLVGEAGGRIRAFENVSGRTAPRWEERTAWGLGDLGNDSRPALGDLDGDGAVDVLVGLRTGAVLAWANTGDAAAPFVRSPAWDPPSGGERTTPALGDLDADGVPDLLLADKYAQFTAYRRAGDAWLAQPAWAPADPGSGPLGIALIAGTLGGAPPPPPPPPAPGNTRPVARLAATPSSGTAPLAVRLDASASSDADGDALTFRWDVGDGLGGGSVDADAVLQGMDATYGAAKALRDADRFTDAIDAYLAGAARLLPLTTITRRGPVTKQGTDRVDRVARWYLQKIAHDLGAIYLYNSLGMAACPRYAMALQFVRESALQAVAGGFPSLPDLNGTLANVELATSRLLAGGCDVPAYEPVFAAPPQPAGAVTEHMYGRDGTYTVRVTVDDGELTATATLTVTVGSIEPPPPPPDGELQGFGASTPGGTGGRTIHVRDATESAVRAAIGSANDGGRATIVFDVDAPIEVTKRLPSLVGPFVTIEGNGATLYGPRVGMVAPVLEVTGHDIVVRDLRVRNGGDNVRVEGNEAYNVVLSHVSSTGASDDGIAIGYGAHDVTVQHCFLAGNTRSIFLKYGTTTNVSIHDTWIMKQWIRGPLISQNVFADIRNIIVEDWTLWGLRFERGARGNVVDSLFRLSPYADRIGGKADSALRTGGRPVFTSGNVMAGRVTTLDEGTLGTPHAAPVVATRRVAEMVPRVEAQAGTMPRDAVDQAYIDAVDWRVSRGRPFRLGPGS